MTLNSKMNSSSQTTSTSHFDTIGSEDNGDVRQQVIDLDDSNVYVQELRNVSYIIIYSNYLVGVSRLLYII